MHHKSSVVKSPSLPLIKHKGMTGGLDLGKECRSLDWPERPYAVHITLRDIYGNTDNLNTLEHVWSASTLIMDIAPELEMHAIHALNKRTLRPICCC
jgi:hypothetical protein